MTFWYIYIKYRQQRKKGENLITQQSIIGDGEMIIEVWALDRFFHMVPQTKYETLPFARLHKREQALFSIYFEAI